MGKFIEFGHCPRNGDLYVSFPERLGGVYAWTAWNNVMSHHTATGCLPLAVRYHAEHGCSVCHAMLTEFIKQKLLGNI